MLIAANHLVNLFLRFFIQNNKLDVIFCIRRTFMILMQKYKIISVLGDGAFGTVYKATNSKTGEVVAIKKMKSKYKDWEECLELRQIKSLRKLNHPNIIKLKQVLLVSQQLHFVFQYLTTNLYEEYSRRKAEGSPFTQREIKSLLFQLASALCHIHKNGFFHRDLKPQNLLISGNVLKICDFGLARQIRSRPPFTDYVSTRWYRAPQLLLRSTNYNSPVDIFAFGCIAIELYNLSPLFPGINDIDQMNRIVKVLGTPQVAQWPQGFKLAKSLNYSFPSQSGINLTQIVPNLSFQAQDLFRNLFKYSSRRRFTMTEILKHEYFQGVINPAEGEVSKQKEIVFQQKPSGKIVDDSSHQKELEMFRMTKAKFRQTRRHDAIQSDPFKLLNKYQKPSNTKKQDFTEDIDDIIKQLQDKKSKAKLSREIREKPKISRERFYTEVDYKREEEKDYNIGTKIDNKFLKPKEKYQNQEFKKNPADLSSEYGQRQPKNNLFSYGFQPSSLPSIYPISLGKAAYISVTPNLNTKKNPNNLSVNSNPQGDLSNRHKYIFPSISPYRY